jgi:ubiquinone biosynthesis protein UbiJ
MMAAAAEVMIERLLERAVAHACADSPRTAGLLEALRGRRLAIDISGTPWRVVVESTGRTLTLSPAAMAPSADATLIGAPLSLLALTGADAQAVIQRGDVRMEGDTTIAQQFHELALLLRPDLEDMLARLLGRSGAHLALRGMRAAAHWTRSAAWTSVRNVAEYLAHESGELVSQAESEHFLRGVEQARDELDRLEARLTILEQREPAAGVGPVGPR